MSRAFNWIYTEFPDCLEEDIKAAVTTVKDTHRSYLKGADFIRLVAVEIQELQKNRHDARRAQEKAPEGDKPHLEVGQPLRSTSSQTEAYQPSVSAQELKAKVRRVVNEKVAGFAEHYAQHQESYERDALMKARMSEYGYYPPANRYL